MSPLSTLVITTVYGVLSREDRGWCPPPPSAAGTAPSATVKAGHQEGRSLSVPTRCLHILWPKCVVSSVTGPYHGVLVGSSEQVQSNGLLWEGPWDILTISWWGGFLNTWPWIFHLQPMAFQSIIIPYILLYEKICVFGKFIGWWVSMWLSQASLVLVLSPLKPFPPYPPLTRAYGYHKVDVRNYFKEKDVTWGWRGRGWFSEKCGE